MNNKGYINWAIWISVISGIYCLVYLFTVGTFTSQSVLPGYQIIYATFTALPIYFTAGAKREDFWRYVSSYICGVLWSMVYLWIMDQLSAMGVDPWVNIALIVAIVCTVECALHFTVLSKLPFSVVPAHFGAISNAFWLSNLTCSILGPGATSVGGFYNFTAFPILVLTLIGGTLLGLVCQEGLHFINQKTGKYQLPSKENDELL